MLGLYFLFKFMAYMLYGAVVLFLVIAVLTIGLVAAITFLICYVVVWILDKRKERRLAA